MKNKKADWILEYVTGKDVLDLGCVHHNLELADKNNWLHGLLAESSGSLTGVDYLESEVEALNKRGYKVVCADVESMQLDCKFDVVVAGDIIEHLNNTGLFLQQVKEHLKDGGVFLVTTPNPINVMRFCSVLFRGKTGVNFEHTCWFTEEVLVEIARRYDFIPVDIQYLDDTYQYYTGKWYRLVWVPFLVVNFVVSRLRRQFSETICVAFAKRTEEH